MREKEESKKTYLKGYIDGMEYVWEMIISDEDKIRKWVLQDLLVQRGNIDRAIELSLNEIVRLIEWEMNKKKEELVE